MDDAPKTVDRTKLVGEYARLRGVSRALSSNNSSVVSRTFVSDIVDIITRLQAATGEDLRHFNPPQDAVATEGGHTYAVKERVELRLEQLIEYLEMVYHVGAPIIEVGALYNAIKDEEIRSRCSDLLSAPTNFDRAINQATLILEARIRKKANGSTADTGTMLVRKHIPAKPDKPIHLVISKDPGEQDGFGHMCAGIMQAFRNQTHHEITDHFTREDALKVCAFIDNLVRVISRAQLFK